MAQRTGLAPTTSAAQNHAEPSTRGPRAGTRARVRAPPNIFPPEASNFPAVAVPDDVQLLAGTCIVGSLNREEIYCILGCIMPPEHPQIAPNVGRLGCSKSLKTIAGRGFRWITRPTAD